MSAVIQIGQKALTASDLIQKLQQYQLLPQLVQEFIVDEAIASIDADPQKAMESFCARRGIFSEEQRQAYAQQQNQSAEAMLNAAMREYKIHLFQEETWGQQIESYFLQRKGQLDRVCYSLIRTKDASLAQEIYFRLNDDGASFSELARQYSEGQESKTGGLIGPVELNVPHPILSRMLTVSKPGQLWAPTQIGEWLVIARLEQFEPAQFNNTMRSRLLNEKFQEWTNQQLQQTPVRAMSSQSPASSQSAASSQPAEPQQSVPPAAAPQASAAE